MNENQQAEILDRVYAIAERMAAALDGEPLPLATAAAMQILTSLLLRVPHADRLAALTIMTRDIGAVLAADTAATQAERARATVQ